MGRETEASRVAVLVFRVHMLAVPAFSVAFGVGIVPLA